MKLAAIDIGSNSIHLIIAKIHTDGSYDVVDKARDMVGLASKTLEDGFLSDVALADGLEAMRTFKRMADAHGVDDIVAVATSAVREAGNGLEFARQVKDECDIDIRIIAGEEEARLIYLGARDHVDWQGRKALIVDIGGGSVEFIVGAKDKGHFFASLPLGVRRVSKEFLTSDPYEKRELKALRAHIEDGLEDLTQQLNKHDFDFVVGTSGTLNNLAMMVALREQRPIADTHGVWVTLDGITPMARELSGLTSAKRANYPGLDPKRTDNIVAGFQLIKYVLRAAGQETYFACDYALREGLVVDYIDKNGAGLRSPSQGDVRQRSVNDLLRKFNLSGAHPTQAARLTVRLFDQLTQTHGLGPQWRELLEYGALLHDIGYTIHRRSHHKHAQYLIQHGGLTGFDAHEVLLISLVARYHRRAFPAISHPYFGELNETEQSAVTAMAALLRLGNALDRSKTNNVADVEATVSDGCLTLNIHPRSDASLELWALKEASELFQRTFNLTVKTTVQSRQAPEIGWIL